MTLLLVRIGKLKGNDIITMREYALNVPFCRYANVIFYYAFLKQIRTFVDQIMILIRQIQWMLMKMIKPKWNLKSTNS